MQRLDREHLRGQQAMSQDPARCEYPDQVSRSEHGAVPTDFSPDTAQRTKTGVAIAAAIFVLAFVVVSVVRYVHARGVANAGESAYLAPPPVDVVIAQPAKVGQDLVLPGETAAWYETTIYARVNGYVAYWLPEIRERGKQG